MGRTKQTLPKADSVQVTNARLERYRSKQYEAHVGVFLATKKPRDIPLSMLFVRDALTDNTGIVVPDDACAHDAHRFPGLFRYLRPSNELAEVSMKVHEDNFERFANSYAQNLLWMASVWVHDNYPDQVAKHDLFNKICPETCEEDHLWNVAAWRLMDAKDFRDWVGNIDAIASAGLYAHLWASL
jgi:hypothetical protein